MYISNLKIQGFKTFVKKTDLHFGEGITAVVGPNGCGKTNIVDAIRWVLGEQKSSVLRGGKLEDVIFNGAEGLKPLSMCEVSLTVHNNKGKLPIEYTDVEITRRAYRDGESEYFINRTPCRLRDIHDLFMDTGMGADAYSVIELGMIESILSETRDDRKRLFEEAAGINKYKHERRSAMRKFDAVSTDLERINDIIAEVETKVHSLALQLKRYKRHEGLAAKLREKEIALAFLRTNYYQGQLKPLMDRVTELKHLRESNVSQTGRKDDELNQLKDVYRSQRNELDQVQARLSEIESQREATSNNIIVWTEQRNNTAANIERLGKESGNSSTKKKQLLDSIQGWEKDVEVLDPAIEVKLTEYKDRRVEMEKAEEEHSRYQKDVSDIQNTRWNHQQKLSDLKARLERTRQLSTEQSAAIEHSGKQIADSELKQQEKAVEQKDLETSKEQLEKESAVAHEKFERIKTELEAKKEHLRRLENDQQLARSRQVTIQSQLSFYQELIEKNEGYPEGVRFVLEHKADFPEVLGSVGDLFQFEDRYAPALESALGALAYCLVTTDRPAALKVLEQVRGSKAGHLSLIPLKEIAGLANNRSSLPKTDLKVTRVVDLIKADHSYSALVNHIFGNLLLVEDLKAASADTGLRSWELVNEAGEFIGTDYLIKNSQSSGTVALIGRQQKIDELTNSLNKLVEDIERSTRELNRVQQVIKEQNEVLLKSKNDVEKLSTELSRLETALIRNHYDQSKTLEEIQTLTGRIGEQQEKHKQTGLAIEEMIPQVGKLETELGASDERVKAASGQLEQLRRKREIISSKVQELRIEAMNLENQRDNLRFQQRTARETITEQDNRLVEIEAEKESLTGRITELEQSISDGDKALVAVNSRLKQQRSVLDLKQKVFDDTYQSIEELEKQIRLEQRNREALLEELRECEVKSAGYTQQIKIISERIADRYQTKVPTGLVVDESEDELGMIIDRTQRSIDSIGPINMAVQVEHAEEEERLKLLVEQREDLIKSEENLRETIQKIDRVARKQFLDTFTAIKDNFERMFAMFFEGGEGTLSLSGDPDPLEADIAIFAQPPGKRNQSLRILSAGEKALTAIALLFSIYQVKPSPYCILDEVDAPLDDVNINKFTRVLKRFSDETQFIVVTHNKLTMEATNYLYGVTMERKGVSKLVSVKFEE